MTKLMLPNETLLRLEYVPLPQVMAWQWGANSKLHELESLIDAFLRYGFQDPPKFDPNLNDGRGGLAHGNGRTEALALMQQRQMEPPRGIPLDNESGEWLMPVVFGNDLPSQEVASAYAIDHNNLTMAGGDFADWEIARMYDRQKYMSMLRDLDQFEQLPETVESADIFQTIAKDTGNQGWLDDDKEGLTHEEAATDNHIVTADIAVKIGPYRQIIPATAYVPWLEQLKLDAGFGKPEIITELRKRLQL
ncbi:MAG: hypothetical protein IAE79_05835 [Anaerolinea sp.]|nr:hypothetical protein [Anaerolinea sp.]